ncbi:ROK family transcriptional regulator [Kitasatospora atroaurantiaca]|uniref:Putative NBD/HSP70 family sugar kinase n=1 Tax=Kitasatospora atroaurantiaca TaxID=285545 RepID=A0A561EWL7_9ACTN|nr:ROK family transcriptional regulator [Kitasatospora atroaurantiaca]TWE19991.1 putative NBD/HSP70 family sugar kinase [Kitasatospora atroaurantiaca]
MTENTRTPLAGTPSLLRAINDRAALELLLANGPLSRTQIGTLTGLSKPTASQLLARLESAGLVLPVGTTAGGPGPNAQLYQVNPAAGYVAGLDVTTSHVRVAVADITGATLAEHLAPTKGWPAAATVERTAEAVAEAVRKAGLAPDALREIVIGVPGALDPVSGKLRYASHLPGWHSPRLLAELEAALGAPVSIENDVNLAAIAEQSFGAAQGCEDFVLLWAEEGIGAAIVIAGRLHRGFTGGAGEVGYMPVPGAPVIHNVRRKNSGGFQELAGADAVLALAREHGLAAPTAEEAIALALTTPDEGDRFLETLAERLAVGLAVIVSVVDPELVVISGGIPTAGGDRLRGLVQEALAGISIPRPEVRSSTVPGSPVLHGALQRALATAREAAFSTH